MKTETQGALIYAYLLTDSAPNHKLAFKFLAEHVFGSIMNRIKDKEKAEDVFQELSIVLWEKVRKGQLTYQGDPAFFRYIHTTWKQIWYGTLAIEKRYVAYEQTEEQAEEPQPFHSQEQTQIFKHSWKSLNEFEQFLVQAWSTGSSWNDIQQEVNAELSDSKKYSNVSLRMRHSRAMKKLKKSALELQFQLEG